MNLHAVAAAYVAAINPWTPASLGVSKGSAILPNGDVAPQWLWIPGLLIQAQPLKENDLKHLSGLNLQMENMAVYMNGNIEGVDRLAGRGGDMLQFFGKTWLVTGVIENWDADGWTKVACTLQANPT